MSAPASGASSYSGKSALAFTGIFLVLQVTFVALRYITKTLIKGRWGFDDILVGISPVLEIGLATIAFDAILNGGVGEHQQYVAATRPERLQHWFKELWALSWIYNFAATLPKLAILFLYYRLFGTANKFARYNIFILAAILSLYTITLTVLEFCTCTPIAANWDFSIPGARCWNKRVFASWITVPNFLTDIWMMILPIPIVWKVVAPKRLKIGLTFTFLVGSIGLVASIGRFITTVVTNRSESADTTIVAAQLLIWIQLEPGSYLISACLPTLRPLLDRIAGWRIFGGVRTLISGERVTRSESAMEMRSDQRFDRLEDQKIEGG